MRTTVANAAFSIALLASCTGLAQSPPIQSRAAFERAINDDYLGSPYYVLITIKDSKTNQSETYCTMANFLLGAIHREHDLGHDVESIAKARKIAIENTDHVFTFNRPEALTNVHIRYSPADLDNARKSLVERGVPATIDNIFSYGYRDAVACVLIERGASPWVDHRTGRLKLGGKPTYQRRSQCESSVCP